MRNTRSLSAQLSSEMSTRRGGGRRSQRQAAARQTSCFSKGPSALHHYHYHYQRFPLSTFRFTPSFQPEQLTSAPTPFWEAFTEGTPSPLARSSLQWCSPQKEDTGVSWRTICISDPSGGEGSVLDSSGRTGFPREGGSLGKK
eukprot:EG_transcript_24592